VSAAYAELLRAARHWTKSPDEARDPVTEAPGGWAFEFGDPDRHKLAFYQDGALPRR